MSATTDSIHVLHVDDDPEFVDMAATFLEREDSRFTVETATSASEGLGRLVAAEFDCVVSDYDMPGRDGIEFLEAVRDEYPDLPFVLYTGKGSEEIASEAISAGVTDYLQKEGGTDQYTVLANRLANAVEKWRAERAAERTRTRLEAITDNSADAIVTIDTDSVIQFANPAVADLFGYDPADLVGDSLTTLMPPRYRDAHCDAVDRYLETGDRTLDWTDVEFPVLHRDGHEVPVSLSFGEFEQDGEKRFVGVLRDVSDRIESARRLETLISNLPGIVYRCRNEPGWPMEHVRGECEELVGYTAAALESDDVVWGEDVLHPEDRDDIWDAVQKQIEADDPFEVTYRVVTRDGTTKWVWERGRRVTTETGDTVLEGFITDITAREERKRELERTTALLSTLFETLPVGVLAEDASRNVLAVNDRMFELFDLPGDPDDVVGKDCASLAVSVSEMFEDPEGFVERIDELVASREPVRNEELSLSDGRTFVRSHDPIELPEGKGHFWVYHDVTGRTERQRELEQSNALLSALFETLPVGVAVLDRDGTIVQANQRAEDVLGLTESEIVGRTYDAPEWEIIDANGDPIPGEALPFARVKATGEAVFDYEHGIKWPDGSERWLSVNAAPLTTEGGDIERVVAVITDITDRREYERAIERQNERLEEFASVVSHDLRNPLHVADGRLQLAREECDSEHLEPIARAHERMSALIEDLLKLARSGGEVDDTEPVDLAELSAHCWQSVETAEATVDIDADHTIMADRSRLQQLLENLYRNAVEHGGPDVTVTVGDLDDGFYVEDDGPGIPPDKRGRVFEAGYTTSDDGTGFGLSIVEQVATDHDWEIRATEGDDGGARFEITGVLFAD